MSKATPVNSTRVAITGVDIRQDDIPRVTRRRTMSVSNEQAVVMSSGMPPAIPEKDHMRHVTSDGKDPRTEGLERENESLRQQLARARGEEAKALNDFNAVMAENQKLRQRLHQAQTQGSNHQTSLRNDYVNLQIAYNDAVNKLRTADKLRTRTEDQSRQNLESLIGENDRLRETNKENEAYIEQLLNTTMKDGRWNPLPDDTIRDRLDRLHGDTRDWAKRWAREPFSLSHLAPEPKLTTDVRKLFSNFVRCEADGSLPAAVETPSSKMKNKMAGLLLTAAVAHHLEVQFFTNPFFCVQPQQVDTMREVYSDLHKANFQQAHVWRSTTWRILNPPQSQNMTDYEKAVTLESARRMRSLCEEITANFMQGPASVLLTHPGDAERQERSKSLREIFLKAVEVATLLWTQRSYVSCMNMVDMIKQRMMFDVSSATMVAHPMHRIGEDDTNQNGRDILVVTRPTVLAFDDDDNEGLKGDKFRILAKAIVWLDEPKKSSVFR